MRCDTARFYWLASAVNLERAMTAFGVERHLTPHPGELAAEGVVTIRTDSFVVIDKVAKHVVVLCTYMIIYHSK